VQGRAAGLVLGVHLGTSTQQLAQDVDIPLARLQQQQQEAQEAQEGRSKFSYCKATCRRATTLAA
jgi:hypothetical protein